MQSNYRVSSVQSSCHIAKWIVTKFCEHILKTRKHISPTPCQLRGDPRKLEGQPWKTWWPWSVPNLLTMAKGQKAAQPLSFPVHSQQRSYHRSDKRGHHHCSKHWKGRAWSKQNSPEGMGMVHSPQLSGKNFMFPCIFLQLWYM